MAAESNVGARIFLIGKDAALAGLREVQGAVAKLNATIAAGADASKTAAAGDDEQAAAIARMNLAMTTYKANLAETEVQTAALAKVGKVAFYAVAAAAAAWGYESVKWAQSYQTALVQLQTQAGLTARAVRSIGAVAMATASKLGISPTAYLQTIYHPASAGFSIRTSEAITMQASRLAAIGSSSSETTTNALTGVMKSYGMNGRKTALKTAAILNAIIGAGNMHASTLVGALASGVAATAKTFGVSLPSLGSAIAFMTDRGVPARQAGTHLRMTLSLLGAPSAEAATLLKQAGLTTSRIRSSTNSMSQLLQEAGVTSTQLSRALRTNRGKGGIYNALDLLHRTMTAAGLTQQMQGAMISRAFGGGRMGTTIEMMYNSVGQLGQKAEKIQRTGTSTRFMKDWQKETGTLDFQLHRLEATIETIGTSFGTKLIPPLTKVVSLFTDLLKWLDKNKAVVYGLATVVSAVLVPAIGLYLYRALFKTGGAIRTVLNGYANLIKGNTAERLALQKTADQLTLTAGDTERLAQANRILGGSASTVAGKLSLEAGADDALGGAASTAAGKIAIEDEAMAGGGLKGMAGGLASKAMTASMYAMAGLTLSDMIRNGQSATVHRGQTLKQGLESEAGDIAAGAGLGAAAGSIIPGLGTGVGAGVGAGLGALYGVRKTVVHDASSLLAKLGSGQGGNTARGALLGTMFLPGLGTAAGAALGHFVSPHEWTKIDTGAEDAWHDLFGGGDDSSKDKVRVIRFHNHVDVYLNGKKISQAVAKHFKGDAVLSGS